MLEIPGQRSKFVQADNGLLLVARTAESHHGTEDFLPKIAQVNERLSTSSLWSKPLGFGGAQKVEPTEILDKMLMGVFNPKWLESFGFNLERKRWYTLG